MRYALGVGLAGLLLTSAATVRAQMPAFMPMPRLAVVEQGLISVSGQVDVTNEGCRSSLAAGAVERFRIALRARTGNAPGAEPLRLTVVCGDASGEGYRLDTTAKGITLITDGPLGVLRGLATLRQAITQSRDGYAIPLIAIEDAPRFAWRGLMIDVARHFMSIETLKRQIDAMEAVKLNVLHLHLSDNEGFRVESRRFPKLHQIASHGEYYTQTQIRDLIAYATARGVRIVPEFDVPGHSLALLTAYPELAAGPVDPSGYLAGSKVALDPSLPVTYHFLDRLFGEMSTLFPDRYFHVGGDEVGAAAWADRPQIAAFMTRERLASKAALEAHFAGRMREILKSHGKTMIGWDELADSPLPDDVVVQAWRGSRAIVTATRQGNPVIVSAGYYLDLLEPAAFHYAVDPLDAAANGLSAEDAKVARLHPLLRALVSDAQIRDPAAALTTAEASLVMGGEAALWSELVSDEMLDGRLWPRLAAIAERLWSSASVRDEADMYRRLGPVLDGLRLEGIADNANRQRMIARLAPGDTAAVATLVDVVVPVRNFAHRRPLRQLLAGQPVTPQSLDQLADAASADSMTARRFEAAVSEFLHSGKGADALKAQLSSWRDNHARYAAVARGRPALEVALPVSVDIAALAEAGLAALGAIEVGQTLPSEARQNAQALLARQATWAGVSRSIVAVVTAKAQPPADLLIAIARGVQMLVDSASGPTIR